MDHIADGGGGRLSALDTAFLCLESATAPLHLGGLAVFQPGRRIPPAQLLALLCDRAERVPRLRWRVDRSRVLPTPPSWTEDRHFDVRRHVFVHRLPEGDHEGLAALAALLMAEPLDVDRPLWQLHAVTGLTDGRFAVLLKVHHALADGLRALELGMGVLDGLGIRAPNGAVGESAGRGSGSLLGRLTDGAAVGEILSEVVSSAVNGLPQLVREAASSTGIAASVLSELRLTTPGSPLTGETATGGASAGKASAGKASAGGAPAPRRLGLVRLDLSDVRRVRGHHGGTDNDVLLAVLAGAMRDWLADRGQGEPPADLRVLVPVSRRHRPAGTTGGSRVPGRTGPGHGNLLSGYLCPLPVTEPDPVTRLRVVRTAMARNKAAGPARGAGAFPLLADRVPPLLHRLAAPLARHSAGRLFDAVVTNVPVPSLPLTLGGAPLRELFPVVPLAHGQALGVALSTFQGTVHVCLHVDVHAVPDLDRLADAIPAALTDLVKTTDEAR